MNINELVKDIKERELSSERMALYANCWVKLASKHTNEICYLDCLLEEARKEFPHYNMETLKKRNGMDEEKLAYTIVGILSILDGKGIQKGIDEIFTECKSTMKLGERMDAELNAKAKTKRKPK